VTGMSDSLDRDIRWHVYDSAMKCGILPTSRDLAERLGVAIDDVREGLQRLGAARMLVLQRDGEILMAMPFSTVPTPFVVETAEFSAYGNCIWDAMGIAAMTHRDARIVTSCADCGTASEVRVEGGEVFGEGVVHFAIPARDCASRAAR